MISSAPDFNNLIFQCQWEYCLERFFFLPRVYRPHRLLLATLAGHPRTSLHRIFSISIWKRKQATSHFSKVIHQRRNVCLSLEYLTIVLQVSMVENAIYVYTWNISVAVGYLNFWLTRKGCSLCNFPWDYPVYLHILFLNTTKFMQLFSTPQLSPFIILYSNPFSFFMLISGSLHPMNVTFLSWS